MINTKALDITLTQFLLPHGSSMPCAEGRRERAATMASAVQAAGSSRVRSPTTPSKAAYTAAFCRATLALAIPVREGGMKQKKQWRRVPAFL